MGKPIDKINYPAIVEKAAEGVAVFFPDLPGCTTAGTTARDAALNAEETLQGYIDLSVDHGDTIPEPSALDRVAVDPAVVEATRLLVRTKLP